MKNIRIITISIDSLYYDMFFDLFWSGYENLRFKSNGDIEIIFTKRGEK